MTQQGRGVSAMDAAEVMSPRVRLAGLWCLTLQGHLPVAVMVPAVMATVVLYRALAFHDGHWKQRLSSSDGSLSAG